MPDYASRSVMAFEVQFSSPLFMDRHHGLGDLLSFLNVPISQGGEGFNDCYVELNVTPHGIGIKSFLSCPCELPVASRSLNMQKSIFRIFQSSADPVAPLARLFSLRQLEGLMNVIKVVQAVLIWVDGRGDAGASLRLWTILRLL